MEKSNEISESNGTKDQSNVETEVNSSEWVEIKKVEEEPSVVEEVKVVPGSPKPKPEKTKMPLTKKKTVIVLALIIALVLCIGLLLGYNLGITTATNVLNCTGTI